MENRPCQVCGQPIDLGKTPHDERYLRLYCSRSCSSRMGNIMSPRNAVRASYVKKPGIHKDGRYSACVECSASLDLGYNALFCDDTCRLSFWARFNIDRPARDKSQPKTTKPPKQCPHCGVKIHRTSSTCRKCRPQGHRGGGGHGRGGRFSTNPINVVELWLTGDFSGSQGPKSPCVVHKNIREYLYKEANYSCTKCGFKEVHPVDGKPILQLNHVDGDASNNSRVNLEVLCPNCHAMTYNYGSRNKVSSRKRKRS